MNDTLSLLAVKALAHWQLDGQLVLIKHRENAVYRLDTATGERFAMRIHRPNYHSDQALNSELLWMQAIATAGINTPRIIPCSNGNHFAKVSTDLISSRQVDILSWVEGEQVGSVERGLNKDADWIKKTYGHIGELAAKLHTHSCHWQPPANFIRHAWDYQGLLGDSPLWGPFWRLKELNAEQLLLIKTARDRARIEMQNLSQSAEHYGLIHADLVPENILVAKGKTQLIDFDDSGYGWYLFELATALYFIQNEKNYALAKTALLESYLYHRQLTPDFMNQLPLFMLARSFTYLGWVLERDSPEGQSLKPMLIDLCCQTCEDYLSQ